MFSTFFKTSPLVDEATREWIFDTFAWCIDQLDGDYFKESSELVLPSNSFYPGSSSSVEEMSERIFANTLNYAGMTKWPIRLISAHSFIQRPMPQLTFSSRLRSESACINDKLSNQLSPSSTNASTKVTFKVDGEEVKEEEVEAKEITPKIDIAFHQSQLNQPQDLIAYLVQRLANILIVQHNAAAPSMSPPGGNEVLAHTIDLVACFMGFGVIFANTAYQFKGGCGSCNNQNLNRQAALPEVETVYALALFTVLKGTEIKQVKKNLKSHLYKTFKLAHKEISMYLQHTDNAKHSKLLGVIA